MCDKFVNRDHLSRHLDRVQQQDAAPSPEHSSKDGEPAFVVFNSHSLAIMSLTAAFRVSEYSVMLLPLLFAHWLYSSECCAENHCHPVPCDEIVDLGRGGNGVTRYSPGRNCERRPMAIAMSV
jgi:hypothetical protein